MLIGKIPMNHESFAIAKVSLKRWIVLSVYEQFLSCPDTGKPLKCKGATIVYGPDLFLACKRFVSREESK